MKCQDRGEAEQLLLDEYAEEELVDHLESKFGPVQELFHINYQAWDILAKFASYSRSVSTD